MQDQISSAPCLKDCCSGRASCHIETPDLAIFGTPCNPFSVHRHTRRNPGNVEGHRLYDVTFTDAVEWLVRFEPVTVVMEQVEGFGAPLSCDDLSETPLNRLLDCILVLLVYVCGQSGGGGGGGFETAP